MRTSLKAAVLLLVHAVLLLLAFPGLDDLGPRSLSRERERRQVIAAVGPAWAEVGFTIARFNARYRLPLIRRLNVLERPFRVKQSYNLYRNGPPRVRRLEITVDGRLVYRTSDPAHRWRGAQLSSRRLRPVVEHTAQGDSRNWEGLARYVAREARRDFPQARRVVLRAVVGPYPGTDLRPAHRVVLEAPDWIPRREPR